MEVGGKNMIYRVEILTPLHIGSGYYLDRMDYICEGNWFYAISLDRLLRHSAVDAREFASLMNRPDFRLKEYLRQRKIPLQEVSRYKAKIEKPPGGRVHEQIKNAHFYPYLPGSTVKGAIRTSIIWEAWHGENKQKLLASTAERLRDIKHQLERASNEKQK
ncbi:MAG TPA: type III-A CRISPR-associated RAMP protein Csm5, partial [Deltaproteobacteria bacterium]|nr:type III-A CRISPR-associated RAMP protein Csm5 [Deltaproteobacteria bacterium]